MRPFQRAAAPEFFDEAEQTRLNADFALARERQPAHPFRWPTNLGDRLRTALEALTQSHCAYCDGFPLRERERTPSIDHFRPKGRPEFVRLAYSWSNLYLACGHCNGHKLEQWSEHLIAPDEPDFRFERYFYIRDLKDGLVAANPHASPEDQRRAEETIRIFGWNEGDQPRARVREARHWRMQLRAAGRGEEQQPVLADFPYRFLLQELR